MTAIALESSTQIFDHARRSGASFKCRILSPGWLRCSSVTYLQYAPSSRLAIRAPRPRSSTDLAIRGPLLRGLAAVALQPIMQDRRESAVGRRIQGHRDSQVRIGERLALRSELGAHVDGVDGLAVVVVRRIGQNDERGHG